MAVLVLAAMIPAFLGSAYGEANCPQSDIVLEFVAPERAGAPVASGTACVWYANGSDTLQQPIILMDGFDPGDTRDHMGVRHITGEGLISVLEDEGYSLAILNFDQGSGYMQDNAQILRQLIVQIGDKMDEDDSITVVGTSMGGLISRYALASMEDAGEEHHTDLFVSFDSPHKGAVVPLGNQYFIKYASGINSLAEYYLSSQLYSEAARQLLIYHELHSPGAVGTDTIHDISVHINEPQPDPLFVEFYGQLEELGYPEDLRKVAIASGDGYGMGQGFEDGSLLVTYELNSIFLGAVGNSYALKSGESDHLIFEGRLNPLGPADHKFNVYVSNVLPYEGAPGGWRATSQLLEGDAGCLYVAGLCVVELGYVSALVEHENYIPTHSALGIDISSINNDPYADIDAAYRNDTSITPFDKIYYPSGNQEHAVITPENEQWFLCEILTGNQAAYERHCLVASDDTG